MLTNDGGARYTRSMSHVGILFDPRYKDHSTGNGHPERPARLDAVASALEWSGFLAGSPRIEAEPLEETTIEQVHKPEYVRRVKAACEAGRAFVDSPDSAVCSASYEIARLAAGGVVQAVRQVATGKLIRAFCAVRPPGHHAEFDRSMGFCLFNNVALAAHVLKRDFGLQRVLVLDWDVHHGNGTQHLFETDPQIYFVSLHGHPDTLYPGTGYEYERGVGPGEGFTLNVPIAPGTSDSRYCRAFEEKVLPEIERFAPEFVLLSAGFDAHADDPLGNLSLSDESFGWMLRQVLQLANRHAGGRVVSVMEGGYNLEVLRRCVAEHVHLLNDG